MSARLPVLTYHSLDDSGSVLSVSPGEFARQMRSLHEQGVRGLSLGEAAEAWRRGRLPARAVAITFDDGFASVYEKALPVLTSYGLTATVFLVTDYCGRENTWPTQPPGVIRRPLLTWAQVRELSRAGFEFGAHTRTHPDLTRLGRRDAEQEIVASKEVTEDQVQRPVTAFAYPYGAYDDRIRALAAEHFSLACSTSLGFVGPESDALVLERLDMYYLRPPWLFRRLFSAEIRAYLGARRIARGVRRWASRRNGC